MTPPSGGILETPRPADGSAALGGITVELVGEDGRGDWAGFIRSRDDACFVDDWRWREVVEESYGLPSAWFLARRQGRVVGSLGLTLTRHPVFGTYLASAPFGSYGGFYFDSPEVAHALLDAAEGFRREVGARYVNVRGLPNLPLSAEGWHLDPSYATYWLRLPPSSEEFLADHLPKKVRWLVRKAHAGGLTFSLGSAELLDDFLFVMERSMKDLGSPYHARRYLDRLLERFGPDARLGVAYASHGVPVGASLLMVHGAGATQVHANTLRDYRSLLPAEFLYSQVIRACCERGIRRLDLGRSLIGSGNELFKLKWRPERRVLDYWFRLSRPSARPPALNPANPRFQLAIRTWQRLPLWLLRHMGPGVIRGIL